MRRIRFFHSSLPAPDRTRTFRPHIIQCPCPEELLSTWYPPSRRYFQFIRHTRSPTATCARTNTFVPHLVPCGCFHLGANRHFARARVLFPRDVFRLPVSSPPHVVRGAHAHQNTRTKRADF